MSKKILEFCKRIYTRRKNKKMNDSDIFAIVLIFLMIMYIWIKSKDNAHKKIFDYFNNRQIDIETKSDTDLDNDPIEFSMTGEKSSLLLSAIHNEADWITFKVFIMAIIFMVCLQTIGFAVRLIGTDSINLDDNILEIADQKLANFGENFNDFGKKMIDDDDRTFTQMFVNEDTLGNKDVFNVIYEFAMSFKLMLLSFVLMYGFNYMYVLFIVRDDENVTEDALHMHTDIMMFVVLIILIYLLFYMVISKQ